MDTSYIDADFNWRELPTDEVVAQFLAVNGISEQELRDALLSKKLFSIETRKSKPVQVYRVQFSILGNKIKIGYIRLWLCLHQVSKRADFCWMKFVDKAILTKEVTRRSLVIEILVKKIKAIWSKMEELDLSTILSRGRARKRQAEMVEIDEHFKDNVDISNNSESVEQSVVEEENPETYEDVHEEGTREVHDVFGLLVQDPLAGLAIDANRAKELYADDDPVPLEARVKALRTTLKTKACSAQYCRVNNLFLLWLHHNDPELFSARGVLRIDVGNCYKFLKLMEEGKVARTGEEPSIIQVLKGKLSFTPRGSRKRFSYPSAMLALAALNTLHQHQGTLLNSDDCLGIRMHPIINQWKDNMKAFEITARGENPSDHAGSLALGGCPLTHKRQQATHLLNENTFVSLRNRCVLLCQCFSISRYSELTHWNFAHLSQFQFSTWLPCVGRQDIKILFVAQRRYKNKITVEDDLRVILRHKDIDLCPMSSLSLFTFIRFSMWNETPIDFRDSRWARVVCFRTERSRFVSLSTKTSYIQRRQMYDETGTGVRGKSNHEPRHIGSLIATLCGLSRAEIEAFGLWKMGSLTSAYEKWPMADSVAKFANFRSAKEYLLPRAKAEIDDFLTENPQAIELFHGFCSFLTDPSQIHHVEQMRGSQSLCVTAYDALKLLKTVFFQDVVYLHDKKPNLCIFSARCFMENWNHFLAWKQFVKNKEQEPSSSFDENGLSTFPKTVVSDLQEIRDEIHDLKSKDNTTTGKIDQALYLLNRISRNKSQPTSCSIKRSKSAIQSGEEDVDYSSKMTKRARQTIQGTKEHILSSMSSLGELDLNGLWAEWSCGFSFEGKQWPSLKVLEERRKRSRKTYFQPSLETLIRRKTQICRYIEKIAKEKKGIIHAIEHVKGLQQSLGNVSLYCLWKHIRQNLNV